MTEFIMTFAVFAMCLLAMAVGVLVFKRAPIKGTCGGLNNCHCRESGQVSCK